MSIVTKAIKAIGGGIGSVFNPPSAPKIEPPPPPPNAPTRADAVNMGTPRAGSSLISSGSAQGLTRKATVRKRSLIGG